MCAFIHFDPIRLDESTFTYSKVMQLSTVQCIVESPLIIIIHSYLIEIQDLLLSCSHAPGVNKHLSVLEEII